MTGSTGTGEVKALKIPSTVNKCQNFEGERNFMKSVLYSYGGESSKTKALKLHKQFARSSKEKKLRLIKAAILKFSA